jgi:hypothetical protein
MRQNGLMTALHLVLSVTLTIGAMVAASAGVDGQEAPRGVAQQISAVSGEVQEVDHVGRMVTIRVGNTIQAPIYAGPDMPIFDQLNRGDVVTIRYYDALIVEITPGARMAPPKDTTAEAQAKVNRPDAAVLQQTSYVVTVDSVDETTGMVTYHGVDNRRVQRLAQNRNLIAGLKPGDVVTLRQTRAQAASIEKR